LLYKIYSLYTRWELVAAKKKNNGEASKNKYLNIFRAKPEKLMQPIQINIINTI
jgi:hypothetical protein